MTPAALLVLCLAQEPFELKDGDRVVFLGNGFAEREAAHGMIEASLVRRFPGRSLSFRNLGWSGDAVDVRLRPNGFPNLEAWLEEVKPSVIFAAFGMNESFAGEKGLAPFEKGLAQLLDLLAKEKARIVLLSPIRHEDLGPPLPDPAEHNRGLKLYIDAMRRVARERKLAFVDLSTLSASRGETLTENGIHLNPHGYSKAAEAILRALGLDTNPWKVEIREGKASAGGVRVSDLGVAAEVIRFTSQDEFLPAPGDIEPRTLRIAGLAPGLWALKVGGAPVLAVAADEWAKGVTLWIGPEFDRTERLRRLAVEKNALWFHRWRPQNMEYIYGTRSRAQGANVGNPQFASEFRHVESLIAEREADIGTLARPAALRYELSRE